MLAQDEFGNGGYGNFNGHPPPPPSHLQQQQHQNFNMLNGNHHMNPHANMISPRPQSSGPQMNGPPPSMSPHPQQQGPLPPHIQQQINHRNQMFNNQVPSPQQQMMNGQPPLSGMISPHGGRPPGIASPHYPQPGVSPLPPPNGQIQQQGPLPPHLMQHQMMNNNQGRVMSPLQQQPNGNGMISPHPPLPPSQSPHPPHPMMMQNKQHSNENNQNGPQLHGPNGMPPGMIPPPPNRMMPPHHMMPPGMMPPHPHHPHHHPGHPPPPPPNMINPHHPQGNGPNLPPTGHPGHPHHHPHSGPHPPHMMGPPPHHIPPHHQNGKIYPPNMPMIFNPQNPNAPPIYPCGVCHREVQGENDEALMCESGCNFWYHRTCIGMAPEAYLFLKKEIYAEWACDNCVRNKRIALIKYKA